MYWTQGAGSAIDTMLTWPRFGFSNQCSSLVLSANFPQQTFPKFREPFYLPRRKSPCQTVEPSTGVVCSLAQSFKLFEIFPIFGLYAPGLASCTSPYGDLGYDPGPRQQVTRLFYPLAYLPRNSFRGALWWPQPGVHKLDSVGRLT